MIDIGLLKIDGAVFHPVPARKQKIGDDNTQLPVLSTVESRLDGQLEFFLRDRLSRTFASAGQRIKPDPDIKSPTPDLIYAALSGTPPMDIVLPFHPLPALLLEVQAHNSPKGLLAVIRGSCGKVPVILIVKVEQERGLSFETITSGGEVRVDVVIENGLVLTDKTEVFKSALFYAEEDEVVGLVTDDQSGSTYGGPASAYWLREFLGCRYANDIDVITRAWIRATNRVIKTDIKDASQKSALLSAMLAELASNRSSINPKQFVLDHVPLDVQDMALRRLGDEGASSTTFRKSREVAAKAPKRKRILFENGYEVTMPVGIEPDLAKELVEGVEFDILTIRGKVRRVE
jgi:hypothetical protein